ncbi:succinate dehydrogenase cytochrome b subunit [Flavobacterium capsici]|uniref:Succinate dehydrogenase cytochrome b subunit n=1 Tax=Flavobacterium capsici TaxID=3075618 RepID=A0AA96EWX5_9FLAO|nr:MULTISPECIES: succinate dehydrogenase cytochrome b subunit [unclassified Flavobacterium]WNM19552.1 succinate dehydrogenase cytochrome b subunit [Flavobacterium sp. PMR2A8]WNM20941.1 succinate dehydrogenase cytochrome b subunit [Flavobacterium sp. PMTSA4]
MAKSALLKSSLAKKYWMALTGLFLCLFLTGHLAGNLQLLVPNNAVNFNKYALFMTTNPAVKLLSYLTYISILFHAIDGFLLTYQNVKARPIGYAKNNPSKNSSFSSRNMAVLGTIILIFIVTHMVNFWAKMHFDRNMPLVTKVQDNGTGMKQVQIVGTKDSPMPFLNANNEYVISEKFIKDVKEQTQGKYDLKLEHGTTLINKVDGEVVFEGYKDLYKITVAFFKSEGKFMGTIPKQGLLFTILYVLAMATLAFHLWHGFQSAFQSLGLNHPKYTPAIKGFGKFFAIVVPTLFAVIPVYIHFFLK